MKSVFALVFLCTGLVSSLSALELAVPFTDNMILQRGKEVPVWGFDQPGSKVVVEFAGQTRKVVTNKEGDWMVRLKPLKASLEERTLKVTNNQGEQISLSGVLVGEVWFSSGQSNMVWTAGKSMCRDLARTIATSTNEVPVREINIDTVSALYPQIRGASAEGWKRSKAADGFSALSLSFAWEIYRELKIPVGILLSAHSNTRIEAFTQREAIEKHAGLKKDRDLIHQADPLLEAGREAYHRYEQDLKQWQGEAGKMALAGGRIPSRPGLPGIAGMWRGPSQFYNGKIAPVVPYSIRGAIWCQGTSNSGDGRIYADRMEALVRGWREAWGMPEMPFYFTQMQCYGTPDPDSVGFADIRQAQHLFFMRNRENVGMVVQSDLNSARPAGIHYYNKLHPGMRMARWALAKQYGRKVAHAGPIFEGYRVEGNEVVVSFEKESLFGGLMVGSKGMAADYREPGRYVEPAKPTPGAPLNHFRLCGADRKWYAATAKIVGDTVVVKSAEVPKPVGVQYAYSAVPENSNLYNKAGLPATPFAQIDGKFIFEEDDPAKAAALKARYARYTDPDYPIFQIAEYYRDGVILQRDQPIKIWGHANQGETVTLSLDGESRKAVANDLQQWSLTFPARKASTKAIELKASTSHGFERTIRNILVGDVWYLTGSTRLTSEMAFDPRKKEAQPPKLMPLVREFRKKTKASVSATPRKRRFETGGGRYRSAWLVADFSKEGEGVSMFAYHFAKALNRPGIPQGFVTMSAGRGGRSRELASPLSWTSFDGVKNLTDPVFQDRLNELFLQYPHTEVARAAVDRHFDEVDAFVAAILKAGREGDLTKAPLAGPAFPVAGKGGKVAGDMIPTYAFNWCVSPLTPMGVSGVIWIPSEANIGENPSHYAAELTAYAKSLPSTYGQSKVAFYHVLPSKTLVPEIGNPEIPGSVSFPIDRWPKSLKEIAGKLGEAASGR